MNKINFEDDLPLLSDKPDIALAKIQKKIWRYSKRWLFKNDEFVQLFNKRITHIVENLPREKEVKKELETELAYIFHDIYINQGLILSSDIEIATMRSIEHMLDEEWLLRDYIDFVAWKTETLDINNIDFFQDFLNYLTGYISNGVNDTMFYIQACIKISQTSKDWIDILMGHLFERFTMIPDNIISSMIDEHNGYLWGEGIDMDEYITEMMKEEELSYTEAISAFEEMKKSCAAFHIFLVELYNTYIYPKIWKFSEEKQREIRSLLNDFRDIVDPEWFIPLFFDSGNSIETLERNKMVMEWREIH
jgi:hypothetical protein